MVSLRRRTKEDDGGREARNMEVDQIVEDEEKEKSEYTQKKKKQRVEDNQEIDGHQATPEISRYEEERLERMLSHRKVMEGFGIKKLTADQAKLAEDGSSSDYQGTENSSEEDDTDDDKDGDTHDYLGVELQNTLFREDADNPSDLYGISDVSDDDDDIDPSLGNPVIEAENTHNHEEQLIGIPPCERDPNPDERHNKMTYNEKRTMGSLHKRREQIADLKKHAYSLHRVESIWRAWLTCTSASRDEAERKIVQLEGECSELREYIEQHGIANSQEDSSLGRTPITGKITDQAAKLAKLGAEIPQDKIHTFIQALSVATPQDIETALCNILGALARKLHNMSNERREREDKGLIGTLAEIQMFVSINQMLQDILHSKGLWGEEIVPDPNIDRDASAAASLKEMAQSPVTYNMKFAEDALCLALMQVANVLRKKFPDAYANIPLGDICTVEEAKKQPLVILPSWNSQTAGSDDSLRGVTAPPPDCTTNRCCIGEGQGLEVAQKRWTTMSATPRTWGETQKEVPYVLMGYPLLFFVNDSLVRQILEVILEQKLLEEGTESIVEGTLGSTQNVITQLKTGNHDKVISLAGAILLVYLDPGSVKGGIDNPALAVVKGGNGEDWFVLVVAYVPAYTEEPVLTSRRFCSKVKKGKNLFLGWQLH